MNCFYLYIHFFIATNTSSNYASNPSIQNYDSTHIKIKKSSKKVSPTKLQKKINRESLINIISNMDTAQLTEYVTSYINNTPNTTTNDDDKEGLIGFSDNNELTKVKVTTFEIKKDSTIIKTQSTCVTQKQKKKWCGFGGLFSKKTS